MNEWMNEFVFAPSYRDLSRRCCVSIISLLIQFSFKSTTETSECKAHVATSSRPKGLKRRRCVIHNAPIDCVELSDRDGRQNEDVDDHWVLSVLIDINLSLLCYLSAKDNNNNNNYYYCYCCVCSAINVIWVHWLTVCCWLTWLMTSTATLLRLTDIYCVKLCERSHWPMTISAARWTLQLIFSWRAPVARSLSHSLTKLCVVWMCQTCVHVSECVYLVYVYCLFNVVNPGWSEPSTCAISLVSSTIDADTCRLRSIRCWHLHKHWWHCWSVAFLTYSHYNNNNQHNYGPKSKFKMDLLHHHIGPPTKFFHWATSASQILC